VGIQICKPIVYLGAKKVFLKDIVLDKSYDLKNKIGSRIVHIEQKKSVLDMGIVVTKKCIEQYKAKPKFLIFVSQGQEKRLPSCAEEMAHKSNIDNKCLVLTISSGCSGFAQAVYLANKLLSKEMNQGLIVCAEKYSTYIKKSDLKTRLLFSDAASSTLVKYSKKKNLLENFFGYDGQNSNSLEVINDNKKEVLNMDGFRVFLFSIKNIPITIKRIIKKAKNINFFFIHPGSKILLDTIINKVKIKSNKVPTTFHITGNTVSTSLPLLLKDNFNKIKKNDKIVISGFGVGLSYATLLVKWI